MKREAKLVLINRYNNTLVVLRTGARMSLLDATIAIKAVDCKPGDRFLYLDGTVGLQWSDIELIWMKMDPFEVLKIWRELQKRP